LLSGVTAMPWVKRQPAGYLAGRPVAGDERVDAGGERAGREVGADVADVGVAAAIGREVRDLVHAADPEVTETIKRTNRAYFVLHGNICALLPPKDHVNVFLYDGAIVPDPEGIITGGHANKTARTVAIRQNQAINAHALATMFRQIIANNRAGGWRELKPDN
jgi:hypothetical protein